MTGKELNELYAGLTSIAKSWDGDNSTYENAMSMYDSHCTAAQLLTLRCFLNLRGYWLCSKCDRKIPDKEVAQHTDSRLMYHWYSNAKHPIEWRDSN